MPVRPPAHFDDREPSPYLLDPKVTLCRAAIGEMKAERAGELHVRDSGDLMRWMLAKDLVDEVTLVGYSPTPALTWSTRGPALRA
jgi:hypothetical protein